MNKELKNLEVLILTSNRKDGELTVSLLKKAGLEGRTVPTMEDAAKEVENAGALVLSEEILEEKKLDVLRRSLNLQPVWSDLPIILFASSHVSGFSANKRLEWITDYLQNYTLLEKPVRLATLITVVRSALYSRKKQFELKIKAALLHHGP